MSYDLDGADAFDKVLDKLVEEGRSRAHDIDARRSAEAERNEAVLKLANVRTELGAAQASLAKYRGADDAIENLYTRVENACQILGTQAGPLRDALAAAKKFIDPIPF